jgi:hypothetical protein
MQYSVTKPVDFIACFKPVIYLNQIWLTASFGDLHTINELGKATLSTVVYLCRVRSASSSGCDNKVANVH